MGRQWYQAGIKLHEKQLPSNEDDYLGNLEIVKHIAKNFMKKDPFYVGGLKYQPDSFVATLLQNKPKFDDPHEELNLKREKIRSLKLDMYRKLQKCVDGVKGDVEIHLRHQQKLVQRSENNAVRWKRIKEIAEDIEIALEDVTKETFDKQKVKAKVRELQAKRRKEEKEYEKKWKEAIEKVKRYRNTPPKSILDATRLLLRSKSKSILQQALEVQRLYSQQHSLKSSNRRHREKQLAESKKAEIELSALTSIRKRK